MFQGENKMQTEERAIAKENGKRIAAMIDRDYFCPHRFVHGVEKYDDPNTIELKCIDCGKILETAQIRAGKFSLEMQIPFPQVRTP